MIKYFIGPVTKNVVDSVIEFCSYYNESAAFIPSRRQVDVDGGYVNSWDTESFCSYVKKKKQFYFNRKRSWRAWAGLL